MEASSSSSGEQETVVIVSTVLSDFYNKHPEPDVLLRTCRVLHVLIKNASTATSDQNEKYRTIRLSNTKIQTNIVQVDDALDILSIAGFTSSVDEEQCLVYIPSSSSSKLPDLICNLLQTKIHELEEELLEVVSNNKNKNKTTTDTTQQQDKTDNNSNPFLSEKERMERMKKAKLARKAKEDARKLTQQRWEEDKQARQEAAKRREAAMFGHTVDTVASPPPASGVSVQKDLLATDRRIRHQDDESAENVAVASLSSSACAPRDKNDGDTDADTASFPPPSASGVSVNNKDLAAERRHRIRHKQDDDSAEVAVASSARARGNDEADNTNSNNNMDVVVDAANNDNDKPSSMATSPFPAVDTEADDKLWKTLTEHIPHCQADNNIRDTSVYKNKNLPSDNNGRPVTCLKRLYQELKDLETCLPNDRLASIWVRFDEETPQYVRAMMTAPLGTPYAGGLFTFDIKIPNDYPHVPPHVTLLTTGGGRVRFGPNLYANGTVCLSLLGTWSGPKWSPSHSNLYQVLVSIQGLILGTEQPYFLEPGHGGWEGNVKDRDYVARGQTLTGKTVQMECGVPPHVQQYNTVLRVGTVRFAMLETLSGCKRAGQYLKVFEGVIQRHFYCNRRAILEQVRQWPSEPATESGDNRGIRIPASAASVGNLKTLLPILEQRLSSLTDPSTSSTSDDQLEAGGASDESESVGDRKMAAVPSKQLASAKKHKTGDSSDMAVDAAPKAPVVSALPSKADGLRARMQEAASSHNFILAGRLQEDLQKVEELENGIQKAAAEGNFIRAGRLQEQLESLLSTDETTGAPDGPTTYAYDDSAQNEAFDDASDDGMDDGMDGGMVGGMSLAGHASYGGGHHTWGSGHALNSTPSQKPMSSSSGSATVQNEGTVPGVVIRKKTPMSSVCRLRFRLPQSATHLEDFDRSALLSTVYASLESVLSAKDSSDEIMQGQPGSGHDVALPLRTHGAFAQPQSSAGFTLLLSHPKREFNLEMHGTKTLTELGLVPSATLTVMKCADRGVARRGEVESRLAEADGGAMDVEGLSYEGLLELTERVGAAKPIAVTKEVLDQNSSLLSPSDIMDDEDKEASCPICLGDYDSADTNKTLRKLHRCGHHMHAACLQTWLGTKSSCPMCKSSIAGEA